MKLVALAGGVGAAKLLSGLYGLIPLDDLCVIVNTGDDFQWLGLQICPDIDTVIYTLGGVVNPTSGWGLAEDTFHGLQRLGQLGCDTWFRVGDRDLATHIFRSHHLRLGKPLSEVTRLLCEKNSVGATILPMTDGPVRTLVKTDRGILAFQEYFVRERWRPRVQSLIYHGVESCVPAPGILAALTEAEAVVVCPSNPFLSIMPILAVPGIREGLHRGSGIRVAISPIIAGQAIKGPTAKILSELGREVSAVGVAEQYRGLLDIFILDETDAALKERISALGIEARTAETVMDTPEARVHLARQVMELIS